MEGWFRSKFTEEEKEFLKTHLKDKSLGEVRKLFKEKYEKDISRMTLSRFRSEERKIEKKEVLRAEDLQKYLPSPSEVNYIFQFPKGIQLTEDEELEYVQIQNLRISIEEKQVLLRNLAEKIKERLEGGSGYPHGWIHKRRKSLITPRSSMRGY